MPSMEVQGPVPGSGTQGEKCGIMCGMDGERGMGKVAANDKSGQNALVAPTDVLAANSDDFIRSRIFTRFSCRR